MGVAITEVRVYWEIELELKELAHPPGVSPGDCIMPLGQMACNSHTVLLPTPTLHLSTLLYSTPPSSSTAGNETWFLDTRGKKKEWKEKEDVDSTLTKWLMHLRLSQRWSLWLECKIKVRLIYVRRRLLSHYVSVASIGKEFISRHNIIQWCTFVHVRHGMLQLVHIHSQAGLLLHGQERNLLFRHTGKKEK